MPPAWRILAAFLLLAGVLSTAACTSSPAATIEVAATEGVFAPLDIRLTGFDPGSDVVLTANAVAGAREYSSVAVFEVAADGTIDLADTEPASGDWNLPDGMGPFWALSSDEGVEWSDFDEAHTVTLVASDTEGSVLDSVEVVQPGFAAAVTTTPVDGLVASYSIPTATDGPRPGVLVVSGSEGGLTYAEQTARWIAGLGYPALAVSYFGGPGQPEALQNVPVEPVLAGLDHLRAQPEVDPDAVFVFGISRGGELALWVGARHPDLISGVFAPVGAGNLVCGFPDFTDHAWSLGGENLTSRCMDDIDDPPVESLIDVAAIDGPVVLACGGQDELWPSCFFADDIKARRGDAETILIGREDAGHYIAAPPGLPALDARTSVERASANQVVQRGLWTAVVEVLSRAEE
jgi:dienelactone hydrolase